MQLTPASMHMLLFAVCICVTKGLTCMQCKVYKHIWGRHTHERFALKACRSACHVHIVNIETACPTCTLDQLERHTCCFAVNTDTRCLQTSCDQAHSLDAFVPVVASAAPASVSYIAGGTCHGGQMSHSTLSLSPCQQGRQSSSSATGGVGRSHGAPQLGKRKGAVDRCNCSIMQTCQLHKAQAKFRKSLRRGFLSPLAAQGSGEEHVSPCEARGGPSARSQVAPCTVLGPILNFINIAVSCQLPLSLEFC